MGQKNSVDRKNSNSSVLGQHSNPVAPPVAPPVATGGNLKRSCYKKKNMRGGVSTVGWDKFPMNQPPNSVMERATTADRLLYGGKRRTHKRRGNKKSHKVKRHHRRSKRHHKKRH
jgi:hypothetical protein